VTPSKEEGERGREGAGERGRNQLEARVVDSSSDFH